MSTIPGAQFKDCTPQDFGHYFYKTILLWNLTPTKKRIFMCETLAGDLVMGSYLTRRGEIKPKTFSFDTWWSHLDVLPPYGKTFSLGLSAAVWYPSMYKNMKKSYPSLYDSNNSTAIAAANNLQFLGKPQASEITIQNILTSAFSQYYSPYPLPDLKTALRCSASAVAAKGDFVVNNSNRSIYLKGSIIAKCSDSSIIVNSSLSKEILVDIGEVPPEKVVVNESQKFA